MSDTTDSELATHLKNNPRLIGILATMLLLLTQAGSTLAAPSSAVVGP